MSLKDKCAIVGLGYTPQGKCPDWTVRELLLEASTNAIADAGLKPHDIDGVLFSPNYFDPATSFQLQQDLGIQETGLIADYNSMGASGAAMTQLAAMAIEEGLCKNVLVAFVEKSATGPMVMYQSGGVEGSIHNTYGMFGAMPGIGLAAKRHMIQYGTTSRQFAEVAVACRQWACLNPIATMRQPITIEDHQNSRWVAEPFRLLDCCLVSDGGRAWVVTSAEQAKSLPHPPVYLMGFGQGHVCFDLLLRDDFVATGAELSGKTAFKMAGITHEDIDVAYLYDATTYNIITQLEELGFCKRGEGGPFVEGGRLGPGGDFPCNTSGGQLSEIYIQGFTGIPEIVRQLRGDCSERQVDRAEIGLVTNQGGFIAFHSTLIMRR